MNEDLLYTVDPYIVSILFKTKTDEATLEIYTKLVQSMDLVIKGTIKEFLGENGFSEEDIKGVLETEDFETLQPKFKPYLQNIVLIKRLESNNRQFIKLYYDQLIPNLNDEEKSKLEKYLKDSEELLKAKKEEMMESVKALKVILEENGVTSYDELRAKFENSELPTATAESNTVNTDISSLPSIPVDNNIPEPSGSDSSIPSIINSDATPNLEPIPIPVVPGEGAKDGQNVVEVKPEMPVENVTASITDSLASPVKATIIEDEPAPDVSILQTEPELPQSEAPVTATNGEQPQVNAIGQLQNMGIDLNDTLQHPPQT